MKKIIFAITLLVFSFECFAQDIIVKKDGSVIQAKVAKISTTEVEYKKWTNQDGPMYAIDKGEILAITYQNGEKETFEASAPPVIRTQEKKSLNESPSIQKNNELIQSINEAPFSIDGNVDLGKKTKYVGMQYGVKQNSVLHSEELSVRFEIGRVRFEDDFQCMPFGLDKSKVNYVLRTKTKILTYFSVVGYPAFRVSLSNNTDKIMYIDLANTFLTKGQIAEPYYVPTATTTSTTSTTGGTFNLGGITNGLGIGGVAGSLANATTIGGSQGNTTSNVVFSQRIVSIPPHSTISLPIKRLEDNSFMSPITTMRLGNATGIRLNKEIGIGEEILFEESNSPYSLTFFTKFSYDEGISNPVTSSLSLYCKKLLGVEHKNGFFVYLKNLNYSEQGLYTFGYVGK